jgi:hypothetical protein
MKVSETAYLVFKGAQAGEYLSWDLLVKTLLLGQELSTIKKK